VVGQTQDKWTTIDTFSAWDGISNAQLFGCNGGTTTYGQVFTVPGHVCPIQFPFVG
jgi:hypothetical protein